MLIYVQNDTDFFENHVSLQTLAFLSYHKFPVDAGSALSRRDSSTEIENLSKKILQISNLCPERDDAQTSKLSLREIARPARASSDFRLSRYSLSFLSFIHSHSSFLSLYSFVILSFILSHTFAHFTITYFFYNSKYFYMQ